MDDKDRIMELEHLKLDGACWQRKINLSIALLVAEGFFVQNRYRFCVISSYIMVIYGIYNGLFYTLSCCICKKIKAKCR